MTSGSWHFFLTGEHCLFSVVSSRWWTACISLLCWKCHSRSGVQRLGRGCI